MITLSVYDDGKQWFNDSVQHYTITDSQELWYTDVYGNSHMLTDLSQQSYRVRSESADKTSIYVGCAV